MEGAALRAITNPGATKDRRCRSGGDLPPPGLRLPPSRDALRRASSLADGGASPPPIRAPSPHRDTNAAFAAHESTRTTPILAEFPKSIFFFSPRNYAAFLSRRAVARRKTKLFQIVVSNQQRSANSPCRTFREVSCAAKAAFRVRRHGETRRGRRRFQGGRGNASKPAVESTTPIAARRFSMPPGSWSRVAQLHSQNSLKS